MITFHDALIAHGLLPKRPPVPDGRVYRCPTVSHPRKRNGAFMLAEDGRFGWYRDWARDAEPVQWRADGKIAQSLPPPDTGEAERRFRADLARKRAASAEARVFWEFCQPLRFSHPYLESHGLDMTGCGGLRVDTEGWLVVPAYRGAEFSSVQRIAPDGHKLFWTGAPMKGVSYLIDRPGASVTVLAEGLATGLAIYAACPLVRVVIAFSAQNLVTVAKRRRWQGMVAVAADNDHGTEARTGTNPGVEYAREAAAVIGCGVAVPDPDHGTDWSDWRQGEFSRRREVSRGYGKRQVSEWSIRKAVDAELATRITRASSLVNLAYAETA